MLRISRGWVGISLSILTMSAGVGSAQGQQTEKPKSPFSSRFGVFQQPADIYGRSFRAAGGSSPISVVYNVRTPEQEILGTTLRPVDDLVRAQIKIPEGQGLIVGSIEPGGAAEKVGLQVNDILLSLGKKPVAKYDDLIEILKEQKPDQSLELALRRQGVEQSITVRPVSIVTMGPVEQVKTTYIIGVELKPVDELLITQLGDKVKGGLVTTTVIEGKPAAKAGVKPGDILVSINEKPVSSVQDFTSEIQASKGEKLSIAYLRQEVAGVIKIQPESREDRMEENRQEMRLLQLGHEAHPELFLQPQLSQWAATVRLDDSITASTASKQQIESLETQIKALQKAVEEIQAAVKERDKK